MIYAQLMCAAGAVDGRRNDGAQPVGIVDLLAGRRRWVLAPLTAQSYLRNVARRRHTTQARRD